MLQCRRHEKDFLARRDTAYVSRYVAAYDRVSVGAKGTDAAIPSLSILRHMENYRLASHDIVLAMSEVGLTENEGLRGELRAAIQNAEQALEGHDELLILILTCRRHEKDFLLRNDAIYVSRFERSADELLRAVLESDLATGGQFRVPDLIFAYREAFGSLVDRLEDIGLDENSGLRGKMRSAIHQTESVIEKMHSHADVDRECVFRDSINVAATLAALIVIATGLLFKAVKNDTALRG